MIEARPYSKREMDSHFLEIKETLSRIEIQTEKTNGRVTSLENWRWFIAGGLVIIGFAVPLFYSFFITRLSNLETTITAL